MSQVAKRELPIVSLHSYLEHRQAQFKAALPAHIPAEKFIRTFITAAQINPELQACDKQSLMIALMRACNDGLLPDGVEGAIVPYKAKATWVPMYQGLIKLFRNSGQFRHINTGLVYEGEEFTHWIDETGEHFRHVPGENRDARYVRRVYATASTKDGGFFLVEMTMSEINKHKAQSRAARDDAPWKQWPEAMMRKTALRVLSKLLPKSSDLDQVMRRDELSEIGVESTGGLTPIAESSIVDADASIGDRLDNFANNETRPSVAAREGRDASPSESAVPAGVPVDPIVVAYRAGVEAKSKGHLRKAVPGEYREPVRLDEYNAWLMGWDGAPIEHATPLTPKPDDQPDMLRGTS